MAVSWCILLYVTHYSEALNINKHGRRRLKLKPYVKLPRAPQLKVRTLMVDRKHAIHKPHLPDGRGILMESATLYFSLGSKKARRSGP